MLGWRSLREGNMTKTSTDPVANHGFIVLVSLEGKLLLKGDDASAVPRAIMDKIGESLRWMEGVLKVEVDWMGEVEVIDDTSDERAGEVQLTLPLGESEPQL